MLYDAIVIMEESVYDELLESKEFVFYKHASIRGLLELAKRNFCWKVLGGKRKRLVRLDWKKFNEFRRRGGSALLNALHWLYKNQGNGYAFTCMREGAKNTVVDECGDGFQGLIGVKKSLIIN